MSLIAAVSAGANFLFGGSGGVVIGNVLLSDMEVPERITWGGKQQLAIHRFPGGGRVIDAMGHDPHPLAWSGYFRGPFATSRARSLDAMRVAGQPVGVSWGTFSRTVVIASFECDSANGGFLLPYRISCEVMPAASFAAPLGLLGEMQADVATALSNVSALISPVLAPVQAALSAVSSVLPIAGALSGGSAAFVNAQSALSLASGVSGLAIGSADATMGSLIQTAAVNGNVIGGQGGAGGAAALLSLGPATGVIATLQQARGYVGRSVANLFGASA